MEELTIFEDVKIFLIELVMGIFYGSHPWWLLRCRKSGGPGTGGLSIVLSFVLLRKLLAIHGCFQK